MFSVPQRWRHRPAMHARNNEPGTSSGLSLLPGSIAPPPESVRMTRLAPTIPAPLVRAQSASEDLEEQIYTWLHLEDICPTFHLGPGGVHPFRNKHERRLYYFLFKWKHIVRRYLHRRHDRRIWSWKGKVLDWYKTRGRGERHWIENYP